jgi:tripartite ATP-independent transporter DctP family solute receptor
MTLLHTACRASVAAALVLTALTASVAQAAEFRASDIHPEDYPTVLAVRHMGETLAKATNGRLTIKVFAKSALGNEKDTIEQTKLGALAMTRVNVAPMNNICPATMVPTMPFLFRSKEHMRKVLDGDIGAEILKDCEAQGFIGLAFYDSGSRSIYSAKKPIKTVADTKGMKIRVQQSDLWVSLVEAMGANATPMPFGEVYTALKTGLVDAAENNYPSYESTRHFEVAKYFSKTEHSMAPEILLFSKRTWDTLSPDDQKAIRAAAKESVGYMRKLWDEREEKSLATVKAGGAEINEVDKTGFQAAMKPVYDKYITDAHLRDLVKRVQAVQ